MLTSHVNFTQPRGIMTLVTVSFRQTQTNPTQLLSDGISPVGNQNSGEEGTKSNRPPVVPNPLCSDVLQWGHASLPLGHPGSTRTLKLILRNWWPNMQQDIQAFVTACAVCDQG